MWLFGKEWKDFCTRCGDERALLFRKRLLSLVAQFQKMGLDQDGCLWLSDHPALCSVSLILSMVQFVSRFLPICLPLGSPCAMSQHHILCSQALAGIETP